MKHVYNLDGTLVDPTLHKTIQDLVVQSINDAVATGQKYHLGYSCPDCRRKNRFRNISPEVVEVKTEQAVVKGTRSDIVIYRVNEKPIVIEVVVSHDIEQKVRDRYEKSDLPVFMVLAEWWDMADLKQRVIANETINVEITPCPGCIKKAKGKTGRGQTIASSSFG